VRISLGRSGDWLGGGVVRREERGKRGGGGGNSQEMEFGKPQFLQVKAQRSQLNVLKIENRDGFNLLMATQNFAKYIIMHSFFSK
jgi:hypothetical protein